MNKKFTMMLAAFVAAGYTITAEAGVVKVSKPTNGQTYVITNLPAEGNPTLYMSNSNVTADSNKSANAVLISETPLDEIPVEWKIVVDESGQIKILSSDEKNGIQHDGFYYVTADNAELFNLAENHIYFSQSGSTYYFAFPTVDSDPVEMKYDTNTPTEAAGFSFYAKTETLSSTSEEGIAIQIGDEFLTAKVTVSGAELEFVDALTYSQNPVKWNVDASGKASVKLKNAEGEGETTYYLVSETTTSEDASSSTSLRSAEVTKLALSTSTSGQVVLETLSQGDNKYLVVAGTGTSSFIKSDLSLSADVNIADIPTSESVDASEVILPGAPTLVTGVDVAEGLSDKNTKLYVYSLTPAAGYLVAGADGKATVVASPTTKPETYFWSYNETTKEITAKNGTKLVVDSKTKFNQVDANAEGTIFFLQIEGTTGYVQLTANGLELAENAGDATPFSAVKEPQKPITGDELVAAAQGAFSLTYKFGNDEVDNLFKNVTAIEVGDAVDNYAEGTYFVVGAPDNMPLEYTAADDYKALNKLTFVAISPVKSSNFQYEDDNDDKGAGYTLTTVKGEYLVEYDEENGVANGEITYNNAAFAVTKGELNTSELTVAPKDKFYVNGTEAQNEKLQERSDVIIAAVKGADKSMFVSTFNKASEDKIDNDQTATLTPATAVKYSDFLGTEAKIYNIQFLSTTAAPETATTTEEKETKSECNKYLGAGDNVLLAQGADFVDLSLPQNQWVVSNMTTDNVVTFTNRESGQEFSSKLVKVADNEYRLAGCSFGTNTVKYLYVDKNDEKQTATFTADNAMVVKLIPVTAGKNDGYVSGALSENDMVKIAFAPTSKASTVNELFLTVDNSKNTSLKSEGAAEFEVIKTAQKKSAAHTTDIAVLKDGKPVQSATVKDTLNVVTYAFKQVIADKAHYLTADMSEMKETTTPAQFIIKKLNNGKLALVDYSTNFDATIKSGSIAFDANLTTGKVDADNYSVYSVADPDAYISFVGQDAAISLPAKSQHVLFNNEGAYMAVNENNAAIIDGPSELKAEYTKEQLTFWLDTTDSEAIVPTFYITKGSKQFMFNATDSLSRYNEGTASAEEVKAYQMPDDKTAARAIFRAATLKDSNTLTTSIKGESKDLTAKKGIEAYQYQIVLKDKAVADEYVVRSLVEGKPYLYESNGALGFTSDAKKAIVFNIEPTEAPTSNEGVSASDVKVVAQNGSVVVMNAAGKNVVVSTILGQVVVNEVLTSDNATINVPAGIVVVAVEGESFKVNVK